MSGLQLFDHMIAFHNQAYGKTPQQHTISAHLGVNLCMKEQETMIDIDNAKKVQVNIMEVVCNSVSLKVAAQSHLDIKQLKFHSMFVNNPIIMRRSGA